MINIGDALVGKLSEFFTAVIADEVGNVWRCPYCSSKNTYMFLTDSLGTDVDSFNSEFQDNSIETNCHFCRRKVTISQNPSSDEFLLTPYDQVSIPVSKLCSHMDSCKATKLKTNPVTKVDEIIEESILGCDCKFNGHQCVFTHKEREVLLKKYIDPSLNWIDSDISIKFRNYMDIYSFLIKFLPDCQNHRIPYKVNDVPLVYAPFIFNDASWIMSFEFHNKTMYINLKSVLITEETPNCVYPKFLKSYWLSFIETLSKYCN